MNTVTKKIFDFMGTSRWIDTALFFLRIFAGVMMFTFHGLVKFQNFNELAYDFPDPVGWGNVTSFVMIMLAETLGSILLIAGFLVRPAALVLAVGMFTASFLAFPGTPFSVHELSFVYLGIYVTLLISGGGKYAVDRLVFPDKPASVKS